jgi:hypothetical protein
MKNLFLLLIISAFIFAGSSCGNKSADSSGNKITVANFLDSAGKWANKEITITGTVSHVCRESGKKLFLFDKDPDQTVKVNAGKEVSGFDIKLEGSDVEIVGTVVEDARIDKTYLDEWEADIKEQIESGEKKVCTAENNAVKVQNSDSTKAKESAEDPYKAVNEYRKKLEASGKTYIPYYAIDCKTVKEIKKQ